ncbi:aldolase/citrate lyase family protein [Dactylosporangium sp. NPDC000244]|uniref:aldolase/citrate lyase family protein n=1 Tax=Dactylosporangium sp. NPDC000244 TaxID=3154365 RepID=UPI0033290E38
MGTYLFVAGARPARLHDHAPIGPGGWVRLPPGDQGLRATRAVVAPGLVGVCPARSTSAPELAALGAALAEAEESIGLPVGSIAVMPAVETAAGLLAAAELARAPRVTRLLLGEAALRAELGMGAATERDLLWLRSMTVVAGAAARLGPPVADVCPDPGRFEESCQGLARLGFGGRLCEGGEQLQRAAEIFACA